MVFLVNDISSVHSTPIVFVCVAGIVCAGGSDAPVEAPEPMKGIYDAIYRPIGERVPGHEVFK